MLQIVTDDATLYLCADTRINRDEWLVHIIVPINILINIAQDREVTGRCADMKLTILITVSVPVLDYFVFT